MEARGIGRPVGTGARSHLRAVGGTGAAALRRTGTTRRRSSESDESGDANGGDEQLAVVIPFPVTRLISSEPTRLGGLLADYHRHLVRATRSVHTRRAYLSRARDFCSWLEAAGRAGATATATAFARAIGDYVEERRAARRWGPATLNAATAALGSFASSCGHDLPPVRTERLPRRAPTALSPTDEARVIETAVAHGRRSAALVALMAFCGLRVGEVAALDLGDVTGSWVTVRRGKGGHWRTVPVPAAAQGILLAWVSERGRAPGPLFPGAAGTGRAITTRRIAQLLDDVGTRAGVRLHPHALRHCCATRLIRSGVDPVTVAEVLGHGSLECLSVYARPSEADLQAAIELAVVGT